MATSPAPLPAEPPSQIPAPAAKPPIPWWGWVFAGACILIPVIALGGAIPGALGAGTAGGCVYAARNPAWSTLTRVLVCAGITAGAWFVFVVLVLAAAVYSRGRPA